MSVRLPILKAYKTKDLILPSSLTLPFIPVMVPSASPIFMRDIPILTFDSTLYDLIGKYIKNTLIINNSRKEEEI
jgi:hypothetical protein